MVWISKRQWALEVGGVDINHGAVCIAQAILHLSDSIRYMTYRLGTADAASPMGAIEMVGSELHNIADALTGLQK
jgi:hypothetical protein